MQAPQSPPRPRCAGGVVLGDRPLPQAPGPDPTRARDLLAWMLRLYDEELAGGGTEYLRAHAQPAVVAHQVNVFYWYARHLAAGGRVLDWGCNHAPDSCMLRWAMGGRLALHA